MTNYIVKNCPAYDEGDCTSTTVHIPCATACEYIEDCLTKQLIKICESTIDEMIPKVGDDEYAMGRCREAQLILREFNIDRK